MTGKYEMRMVYGVAAGAEILLLVICALRAPKRKSDLAKIVCLYEWAVVFCGLSYCTFLYARQVEIAAIGRSMMYICLDWVLYLFMAYTQRYTSLFESRPWIKRSMLAWSLVNTGMYMCNIWTHHIFRVTLQGAVVEPREYDVLLCASGAASDHIWIDAVSSIPSLSDPL